MSPQRLQLSRTAGWRLPAGARSVARPTRWGNPFRPHHRYVRELATDGPNPIEYHAGKVIAANERVELCADVETAVAWYEAWIRRVPVLAADARRELRGRDLACWCPPGWPCHADALLRIANEEAS